MDNNNNNDNKTTLKYYAAFLKLYNKAIDENIDELDGLPLPIAASIMEGSVSAMVNVAIKVMKLPPQNVLDSFHRIMAATEDIECDGVCEDCDVNMMGGVVVGGNDNNGGRTMH